MLATGIARILEEYQTASASPFADHPLAAFIRGTLPSILADTIGEPTRYRCQGSPGQGRWAAIPWLAVFDLLVTDSAQHGYYPVVLFRRDMSGVYLGLIQGVTEAETKYKGESVDALRVRAEDFRLQLSGAPANFPETKIDLRSEPGDHRARLYEAGIICAALYEVDSLPSELELVAELKHLMGLYGVLTYNESIPIGNSSKESDETAEMNIEDLTRLRYHKRIERNAMLVKEVKRRQGSRCRACSLDFSEVYGPLGQGYIEAHHLTPVYQLKGQRLHLDPERDFAVLCANCHAMIHRSQFVGDIEGFRSTHLSSTSRRPPAIGAS